VLRAPRLQNATNGATGTERNNKDKENKTNGGTARGEGGEGE